MNISTPFIRRPIATSLRCASVARQRCTSSGNRASSGRSTIGASVPSMSNASSGSVASTAARHAMPSGENA